MDGRNKKKLLLTLKPVARDLPLRRRFFLKDRLPKNKLKKRRAAETRVQQPAEEAGDGASDPANLTPQEPAEEQGAKADTEAASGRRGKRGRM